MIAILEFFLSPVGRRIGLAAVVLTLFGACYVKGRIDGKASYQAVLTRQVNKAILNGNGAEAEALKRFDAQKDFPDDGNSRD